LYLHKLRNCCIVEIPTADVGNHSISIEFTVSIATGLIAAALVVEALVAAALIAATLIAAALIATASVAATFCQVQTNINVSAEQFSYKEL